jgi:hypothetical protein
MKLHLFVTPAVRRRDPPCRPGAAGIPGRMNPDFTERWQRPVFPWLCRWYQAESRVATVAGIRRGKEGPPHRVGPSANGISQIELPTDRGLTTNLFWRLIVGP